MEATNYTKQEFDKLIKENKIVVADFFATWCNPCKMLSPQIDALATELEGKAVVVKLDVEKSTELAEEYEVMTVPTVNIFVGGELKESLSGYRQKSAFLEIIEKYL